MNQQIKDLQAKIDEEDKRLLQTVGHGSRYRIMEDIKDLQNELSRAIEQEKIAPETPAEIKATRQRKSIWVEARTAERTFRMATYSKSQRGLWSIRYHFLIQGTMVRQMWTEVASASVGTEREARYNCKLFVNGEMPINITVNQFSPHRDLISMNRPYDRNDSDERRSAERKIVYHPARSNRHAAAIDALERFIIINSDEQTRMSEILDTIDFLKENA